MDQPPTLVVKARPGDSPRPKKLGLQHLPQEILLLIYEYTLVDGIRWDKTHDLDCKFKPQDDGRFEPVIFLQHVVWVHLDKGNERVAGTPPCQCGKRKGLGLMLTCKTIHKSAAPIFWSKNTFCFLDSVDFIATVGHTLRPKCRELIEDISIMNPARDGYPSHVYCRDSKVSQRHFFWDTIQKCKNLRTLDLPAPYLKPTSRFDVRRLERLKQKLPNFTSLTLNYLMPYSHIKLWVDYPTVWVSQRIEKLTYVRCSRSIDPREQDWSTKPVDEMLRDLQYNFRVHVDTAVKTKFLGANLDHLEEYSKTFELIPGIDEYSNSRRITLPNGEKTTIQFYGLPLSKKDRMRRVQKKMALDKRQKQTNKMTHAQNEAVLKAKEKRKESREDEADKALDAYNLNLTERRVRLLDLKSDEVKAEKKQQRKIHRSGKARQESQRCERKRVPPLSSKRIR